MKKTILAATAAVLGAGMARAGNSGETAFNAALTGVSASAASAARALGRSVANGPTILRPAPAGVVIKTKLTTEELRVFIALGKKAFEDHGIAPLMSFGGRRIDAETQTLANGAVALAGVNVTSLDIGDEGFSVDLKGNIVTIRVPKGCSGLEDPYAQGMIRENVYYWMRYARKKGIGVQ